MKGDRTNELVLHNQCFFIFETILGEEVVRRQKVTRTSHLYGTAACKPIFRLGLLNLNTNHLFHRDDHTDPLSDIGFIVVRPRKVMKA